MDWLVVAENQEKWKLLWEQTNSFGVDFFSVFSGKGISINDAKRSKALSQYLLINLRP